MTIGEVRALLDNADAYCEEKLTHLEKSPDEQRFIFTRQEVVDTCSLISDLARMVMGANLYDDLCTTVPLYSSEQG